jgi:hypothetical protein
MRQEGQGGVSADQRLQIELNCSSLDWARQATGGALLVGGFRTIGLGRAASAFAIEPACLMRCRPVLRASFRRS